jgi:hypothetical protein
MEKDILKHQSYWMCMDRHEAPKKLGTLQNI